MSSIGGERKIFGGEELCETLCLSVSYFHGGNIVLDLGRGYWGCWEQKWWNHLLYRQIMSICSFFWSSNDVSCTILFDKVVQRRNQTCQKDGAGRALTFQRGWSGLNLAVLHGPLVSVIPFGGTKAGPFNCIGEPQAPLPYPHVVESVLEHLYFSNY